MTDSRLLLTALAVGLVLVLVTAAVLRRRHSARQVRRSGSPAVRVAAVAAACCTAYSADTSWRFAADYLDMAGTTERASMFAAAELALFATALMARQNLASQGAPGLPGILVWIITGVQVIPAYAESGVVGGTVRAFVGPVMAAMLWHLAMGIELRLHAPGATSTGLAATLGREIRERLLARLGLAHRDRDAAQITRDRATARAVALAARLAESTPRGRATWRGRRLTRRLSKALARAQVGTDPTQRRALLAQLAARRHASALAAVDLPSPWTLTPEPDADEDSVPALAPIPDDGSRPTCPAEGDRLAPGASMPPHCAAQQSETNASPPETEPCTETAPVPRPRRIGRPPTADLEQLIEVARPLFTAHETPTRDAVRQSIRGAGHRISEDRLTRVITHLRTPVREETGFPVEG